ncbi:MAG: hypothetical protein PHS97_05530 [Oscillospiraceae bacterium]|nr:hypothetical protein [Oscillospiraceae bacterium]
MRIDSNIVSAIEAYLSENRIGYVEFSEGMGVSAAAITKWRKVGNGITKSRWEQIFPLIKKYLPTDRIYIDDAGHEQYSSATAKQSSYFFEPKYIPIKVPTFSLKQLEEYDDTLESVAQLGNRLKTQSSEYRPKHPEKSGVFAVVMADNDCDPVLPKGAKLFVCAGERPITGGMVVAKPINGMPFVGKYNKSGNVFSISKLAGEDNIGGETKDARNIISWVFPVLYYEVTTF